MTKMKIITPEIDFRPNKSSLYYGFFIKPLSVKKQYLQGIDVYDVSSPRAIKTLKHVHCVPYKKELDRKSLQAKSLATN